MHWFTVLIIVVVYRLLLFVARTMWPHVWVVWAMSPLARRDAAVAAAAREDEERESSRSEESWVHWREAAGPPVQVDAFQRRAMDSLSGNLQRCRIRGRLHPLRTSHDGMLGICVFAPMDHDRKSCWRRLRNLAPSSGWWPVEADHLDCLVGRDFTTAAGAIRETLQRARTVDVDDLLRKEIEEVQRDLDRTGGTMTVPLPQGNRSRAILSGALGRPPSHLEDEDCDPVPGAVIVMVPTSNPWEVQAHLRHCGEDDRSPEEHVAFHRRWFETYGAEICAVRERGIEMCVTRPPTTVPECDDLLWEHGSYWPSEYAPDTREEQVAEILGSRLWCFLD